MLATKLSPRLAEYFGRFRSVAQSSRSACLLINYDSCVTRGTGHIRRFRHEWYVYADCEDVMKWGFTSTDTTAAQQSYLSFLSYPFRSTMRPSFSERAPS